MAIPTDRRRVLRGVLNGAKVAVALPFLNIFLDGNGTALAAGMPLPTRFGTWFWGLGMSSSIFIPKKIGADYDLPEELAPLADVRQHINLFTNFHLFKDDSPNLCHYSGWVGLRCGGVPSGRTDLPGESIDVTIANKIGGATRFRSLDATATGDARDSFSFSGPNAYNPPEISPVGLYERIFGADFQDPNGATFRPSPRAMMRKSVLSAVMEDRKDLNGVLGTEDRARLDQYFTGVREVEKQLDHQLTKPEPIEICRVPRAITAEIAPGLDSELVAQRHKLMTDLLVMAVACDQTRVINMGYSGSSATTTLKGNQRPHHVATHEELVDEKLGYQPLSSKFIREAMRNWAQFVGAFAAVKEGDGTLLDNMLIYAHSDQEFAKIHSIEGIPMFTAGKAGGKLKTGLHITGDKSASSRLGYTVLKTMGSDARAWGQKSNVTSKEIGEIVA